MACAACGSKGRQSFQQIILADGSSLPTLKYLHCKYQDQFEALFSSLGITATEGNLKALANLADTGGDKSGVLVGTNGKPIVFSVEDILRRIDISRPVNNMCSI